MRISLLLEREPFGTILEETLSRFLASWTGCAHAVSWYEGRPDLKAMQQHVRKLAERVIPCTVGVQVGPAQGSGVIVSKDGFVLTAGHVVGQPGRDVSFILHDGRIVKGKTLGMNQGIDSGMMKITDEGEWPFVELGKSADLKQGQWCMATGHPGGYQRDRKPVVRLGRVLVLQQNVLFTDCALIGGDSGGPLFDMAGRVIGINSRIGQALTANMHVPVDAYHKSWDRLTRSEAWGYPLGQGPFIGIEAEPDAENAKIAKVFDDSPAKKAGLAPGDVITKFDGKAVANIIELGRMVRGKSPGQKVKIELQRGEEALELTIEIGNRGG